MFLPLVPLLRVAVPVEQSLVLIVPALAACALVGWWAGGRIVLAVSWLSLAIWILVTDLPGVPSFVALSKGWALLLVATFGVVSIMSPAQTFFSRALSAVGVSFAIGLALTMFAGKRPDAIERTVKSEYTRRVDSWLTDWEHVSKRKEWQDITKHNPGMVALARASTARAARYSALLGLLAGGIEDPLGHGLSQSGSNG